MKHKPGKYISKGERRSVARRPRSGMPLNDLIEHLAAKSKISLDR